MNQENEKCILKEILKELNYNFTSWDGLFLLRIAEHIIFFGLN